MARLLRHSYGTFAPAEIIGPARWPHHDLFFVHEGVVEIQFPELKRHAALEPGRGVLIWPHTAFQGRVVAAGAARASIQHFDPAKADGDAFTRGIGQKNGFSLQGASPSAELTRDVERAITLGRRELAADIPVRRALLALILIEGGYWERTDRVPTEARLDADRLHRWLQANIARNPGVAELAEVEGLSPSRFRAVFRREHGQTAGEFVLRFREAEARRLLVETRRSLKEIAAALGYADAVVFHRAFKSRVGRTPGEFRRKNRMNG